MACIRTLDGLGDTGPVEGCQVTLKLTPSVLRHAYELLCTTGPFNKWNLPESDDVRFQIATGRSCYGWHDKRRNKKHVIALSGGLIGQLPTLLATMAHEMIHMHIHCAKIRDTSDHGVAFKKFSVQVCRIHSFFDPKNF